MIKKGLEVKYKSLYDSASPKQKEEYQKRLDTVYDFIFDKIIEKYQKLEALKIIKKTNSRK